MITKKKNVFSCAANFLRGKKCVLCGSFKVNRTARGYVKCRKCHKQRSIKKIRTEIGVVSGFYQQQPAYRLATDLGTDYQVVTRVYQKLRLLIYHIAELEGVKLSGEIEMDEAYFGGRRKGKHGRGAQQVKVLYLAFWSAMEGYIHEL